MKVRGSLDLEKNLLSLLLTLNARRASTYWRKDFCNSNVESVTHNTKASLVLWVKHMG